MGEAPGDAREPPRGGYGPPVSGAWRFLAPSATRGDVADDIPAYGRAVFDVALDERQTLAGGAAERLVLDASRVGVSTQHQFCGGLPATYYYLPQIDETYCLNVISSFCLQFIPRSL